MPMDVPPAPQQQFKNEIHSVLLRWWEESDLDETDMAEALLELVDEFCGEALEFECEFEIDDEEDED